MMPKMTLPCQSVNYRFEVDVAPKKFLGGSGPVTYVVELVGGGMTLQLFLADYQARALLIAVESALALPTHQL